MKITQNFLFKQNDETTTVQWEGVENKERCTDFDDDCWGIQCKLSCWMYDPTKGICPFLTGEEVDK